MGRGYDTRNRTSPKVMGRRKTPNRGSKTSACGDQDPRVDVKQPRPHMSAITRAKGQVRGKGDPGSALSAPWPVVAVVQGRGNILKSRVADPPQESGSGPAELRPDSATAKTRSLAERPENLAAADEQWPILLGENTQKLRTQNSRKAKEKLKNFSSETRIIR